MIKIATLNLRHNSDRCEERMPLIVAELLREQPHLVGLQEAWLPTGQAEELARRLREAGLHYECRVQPKLGLEGEREGIAILSRLPIVAYEWLDLRGGNRVAQRVRVFTADGAVDLYNTHLHNPLDADELRRLQAELLLQWAAARSADALPVLVGDWNAKPKSPAIQLVKRTYCSAYEAVHGAEPDLTFPTPLVSRGEAWHGVIDYIFLPQAAAAQGLIAGARRAFAHAAEDDPTLYASDHYGLVAELALQE